MEFDWRNKDRFCLMYKTVYENISNTLKALQIKRPDKKPRQSQPSTQTGPHTDGIEHVDGDNRHLDSTLDRTWTDDAKNHTDGIEHVDGDNRHLDGD